MFHGFKHSNILVCGSGHSIKKYKDELLNFIKKTESTIIGVNFMTSFCIPDYHLWTNRKQYSKLGSCIDTSKSILLFGQSISKSIIRKYTSGPYLTVNYDGESDVLDLNPDYIKGKFRTAGTLAIAIAYLMEAKNIWIAGMDGYTFYSEPELENKYAHQHCYGEGKTDDASWKKCKEKDRVVAESLDQLKAHGVDFSIITPSVFEAHTTNILWSH